MAVNVGQRNVPDTPANRQLEAAQKALDLALHTIKICDNDNVFDPKYRASLTYERKKLQRLVNLAKAGKITKAKADECFHSWCTNAEKGNSYKLLKRMRDYYDSLWR